jgi:hypothetical protein
MVFRVLTSHADSVATEVQRLMSEMKIPMRQFRVSVLSDKSVVEFEVNVSHKQQEEIVTQLNRPGIMTEVVPLEGHHE